GYEEKRLREGLACRAVSYVDHALSDLLDELRVEALTHDDAVVRDVIGVTEDAHHVLDVRVLGLDGLATIRTRVAAEGDGHIDVAVVDGEGSGIVRASEDRCHVLVWVYAVRV